MFMAEVFCVLKFSLNHVVFLYMQDAALKLGVLTEEEFHQYVVPEKMIGPSD